MYALANLYNNILLDLDGTLTDPGLGFIRSMHYALEQLGITTPPESELKQFIGPPLEESFGKLIDDPNTIKEAMQLYRSRYADTGLYENTVYEGISQTLEALTSAGAQLFLATSKPHVFAARILDHFELSRHFSGVYGSELDGTHADKRLLLRHLLATESIATDEVVMVGDRYHDIRAARANGIRSVGVLWGYGSEAELTEAGANTLVSSPLALVSALGQQH